MGGRAPLKGNVIKQFDSHVSCQTPHFYRHRCIGRLAAIKYKEVFFFRAAKPLFRLPGNGLPLYLVPA